jgi:hypothetical protein
LGQTVCGEEENFFYNIRTWLKLPTLLLWLLSIFADAVTDVESSTCDDVWESSEPSEVPRHEDESDLENIH